MPTQLHGPSGSRELGLLKGAAYLLHEELHLAKLLDGPLKQVPVELRPSLIQAQLVGPRLQIERKHMT